MILKLLKQIKIVLTKNKIIIYDLSCPVTGNVRYVGKTSRTTEKK